MTTAGPHDTLISWYRTSARDLPWRRPDASPWEVLVSEIMLQQTPVRRVLPAYHAWLKRWPTPADLAAESAGEAIRQWGRLGYPRRALWLHAAAKAIVTRHGGDVPPNHEELRKLPGVGTYTASAVAVFAFRQRHAVVDTNVRRVLARTVRGEEFPAGSPTVAERSLAESMLPENHERSAVWSVAVMELGALVCTARAPRCDECPVARWCAWRGAGKPAGVGSTLRVGQGYAGTDREVRGRVLAVLRAAERPVARAQLESVWHRPDQRERALDSLIADGLVEVMADGRFTLPR